jgi:hypothetical protein
VPEGEMIMVWIVSFMGMLIPALSATAPSKRCPRSSRSTPPRRDLSFFLSGASTGDKKDRGHISFPQFLYLVA